MCPVRAGGAHRAAALVVGGALAGGIETALRIHEYCRQRSNLPEALGDIRHPGWGRVRTLGCGTFGTVFLAADLRTGRRAALKVANDVESDDLWRETGLLVQAGPHPTLPELFGRGRHWYAMRLYDESTLRDDDVKCMRPDEVGPYLWRIALQLYEVLAFLHDKCIAHCDVRPDNIFVVNRLEHGGANTIVLGDFSNACRIGQDGAPCGRHARCLTSEHVASPECLLHQDCWLEPRHLDCRACDVWGAAWCVVGHRLPSPRDGAWGRRMLNGENCWSRLEPLGPLGELIARKVFVPQARRMSAAGLAYAVRGMQPPPADAVRGMQPPPADA